MPLLANSQQRKERRVYYVDCTYSMKQLGLWDDVRENLKRAICNVDDATTDLIVIPFSDCKTVHYPLPVYQRFATEEGKKELCDLIDNLKCDKNTQTIHNIPLQDFFKNRVDFSRVTYMFLMTDGKNESEQEKFNEGLSSWQQKYGDKHVYGFYVMLHKEAKSSTVEPIIATQSHLWKVESADININLLRFETKAVFNIRNEKYIDIPFYGNPSGLSINAQFIDCSLYKVRKSELNAGKLRVYIEPVANNGLATLPNEIEIPMSICISGENKYTFLVTNQVDVMCKNEKEYTLKVSVR